MKPIGSCGGLGVWEFRAEICTLVYDPVCGCDGMTYRNDCTAAANGVSIDYIGECVPLSKKYYFVVCMHIAKLDAHLSCNGKHGGP